jgi:hypothetical protein
MFEKGVDKMTRQRKAQLIFYVISLLLIALLAALTLTTQPANAQTQKGNTSAAFGAICMLGIAAGISPSRCNRLFIHFQTDKPTRIEQRDTVQNKQKIPYMGHHPTCGNFSSHVIRIGGKIYCAGCAGLVVGAVIALTGTAYYFFLQDISAQLVVALFWAGLAAVTVGLLQYELFINRASLHFALNIIFVVGALLLLIGINEINGSPSLSIYFLLVILFLINTRSTLSRLEHEKKCSICKAENCNAK